MDILIKNIDMPKGDIPLVLIIASDGTVEEIDDSDEINATDAKAIEIPPHGDLIDSKELFFKFNSEMRDIYGTAVNPFCIAVADAPTVLEASI